MPNTKSAGRRMRNSARKQARNRGVKSRLHNLERNFAELLNTGKKAEAETALRLLSSAFDKAAKTGVVNKLLASRKKSRLNLRLKSVAAKPAPDAAAKPA